MLTLAVLSGPWPRLGLLVAAVLVAGAMLLRRCDLRAAAMLGALVLCPVLLFDDVWHSGQLRFVHHHPLVAGAGGVVALIAIAVLAYVIHRKPWILGPLTMLTLPFRIPINAGGTTSNLLVPLYFVVAAAALAWIVPTLWAYRPSGDPAQRPPRRDATLLFEKLLAVYVVLYAIQALYASDTVVNGGQSAFDKAVQNSVFFYIPFAILFTLLRDLKWDRQLLLRCLGVTMVMALLFACVGFYEEATKTVLLSSKLTAANQQHEYFTVDSVFFDPNIFGRYLALVMILVTTVLLYDRRPKFQVGACAVLAVLWAGMLFTLSRSSLIALLLGLAVLAAARWRIKPVVALGVAVAVAGVVVVIVSPSTFGLNQGLNGVSSGRANLISGGVRLFAERPIEGHGSGSFATAYYVKFTQEAHSVDESHDIPVTVAAEQGLIGLAVYLTLVITAILTLGRGARGSPARLAVLAAFLALLLHTLLYADFLEDPSTWALLAIGGALALGNGRQSTQPAGADAVKRAAVGV